MNTVGTPLLCGADSAVVVVIMHFSHRSAFQGRRGAHGMTKSETGRGLVYSLRNALSLTPPFW